MVCCPMRGCLLCCWCEATSHWHGCWPMAGSWEECWGKKLLLLLLRCQTAPLWQPLVPAGACATSPHTWGAVTVLCPVWCLKWPITYRLNLYCRFRIALLRKLGHC